ncbi:MAG: galactokinase, partial [Anaerolineae bacterium]
YNDGFVLPMAIERATWLAVRPRTDRQVQVHSLDFPEPVHFSLDKLEKETGWGEYLKGLAYVLRAEGFQLTGWDGVLVSDVPIGAGLSSSAALEMAAMRAYTAVAHLPWQPSRLARLAQRADNEWVGVQSGVMDQMISANGRAGYALLIDCRDLSTQQLPLPVETAVLILDTMTRHSHAESGYNERRASCEQAAAFIGVPALRDVSLQDFLAREAEMEPLMRRRARHVVSENVRTLNAAVAMQNGDAQMLGRLMNDSHTSLRDDFEVTNEQLDVMARLAQAQPGCFGARMTGGGFGGCAVALVEAERAAEIGTAVAQAYTAATGLEPQIYISRPDEGTSIVPD